MLKVSGIRLSIKDSILFVLNVDAMVIIQEIVYIQGMRRVHLWSIINRY